MDHFMKYLKNINKTYSGKKTGWGFIGGKRRIIRTCFRGGGELKEIAL